jgi:hypothetical protein
MVLLNETPAGNAAEIAWVSRLQVFILELGYGFCFVSRPHLQRIVCGIPGTSMISFVKGKTEIAMISIDKQ